LAQHQQRWLTYGTSVVAADMADCERLTGTCPAGQDDMMRVVEAYVAQAEQGDDARLIQHFHNWLRRQDFLLTGCGAASSFVGLDLQAIPARQG
jgi:redox-regulated HSP33 family molecular chaperone